MSSRVRYAIVVVPLCGTHWSYLPLFQACVRVGPAVRQILEELQAEVRRVRDGTAARSRAPFGWYQTGSPEGSVTARGSPKPRTPRSVPK